MPVKRITSEVIHELDAKRELLLSQKKLILILDLDQTILHSTQLIGYVGNPQEVEPMSPVLPDVHLIGIHGTARFVIKFRPGLRDFLLSVHKLYEIHVYTMANREYAAMVIRVILENILVNVDDVVKKEIFGNRVVTRCHIEDDYDTLLKKNGSIDYLIRLKEKKKDILHVTHDPSIAVILDDTKSVWPDYADHLIPISRFEYWNRSESEPLPIPLPMTSSLIVNSNSPSTLKNKKRSLVTSGNASQEDNLIDVSDDQNQHQNQNRIDRLRKASLSLFEPKLQHQPLESLHFTHDDEFRELQPQPKRRLDSKHSEYHENNENSVYTLQPTTQIDPVDFSVETTFEISQNSHLELSTTIILEDNIDRNDCSKIDDSDLPYCDDNNKNQVLSKSFQLHTNNVEEAEELMDLSALNNNVEQDSVENHHALALQYIPPLPTTPATSHCISPFGLHYYASEENDTVLRSMASVLSKLHSEFFELPEWSSRRRVQLILPRIRSSVLQGCGIYSPEISLRLLQQSVSFSQDWVDAVAEKKIILSSFGASFIEHEFSENSNDMTHVVLSDCVEQIESTYIPNKHRQKQDGLYFVVDTWLDDSIKHWQCQNELDYAVDESLFSLCRQNNNTILFDDEDSTTELQSIQITDE